MCFNTKSHDLGNLHIWPYKKHLLQRSEQDLQRGMFGRAPAYQDDMMIFWGFKDP